MNVKLWDWQKVTFNFKNYLKQVVNIVFFYYFLSLSTLNCTVATMLLAPVFLYSPPVPFLSVRWCLSKWLGFICMCSTKLVDFFIMNDWLCTSKPRFFVLKIKIYKRGLYFVKTIYKGNKDCLAALYAYVPCTLLKYLWNIFCCNIKAFVLD